VYIDLYVFQKKWENTLDRTFLEEDRPGEEALTSQYTTFTRFTHPCLRQGGTCKPSKGVAEDLRLRPCGHNGVD